MKKPEGGCPVHTHMESDGRCECIPTKPKTIWLVEWVASSKPFNTKPVLGLSLMSKSKELVADTPEKVIAWVRKQSEYTNVLSLKRIGTVPDYGEA